jgi:hypothetical protein
MATTSELAVQLTIAIMEKVNPAAAERTLQRYPGWVIETFDSCFDAITAKEKEGKSGVSVS